MDDNENLKTDEEPSINEPQHSARGLWATVIVLLCATAISLAVAIRERGREAEFSSQNAALNSTLDQTRGQVSTLASKINALQAAQTPEAAKPARTKTLASARRRAAVRRVRRPSPEERRLNKLQAELEENQKQLNSTQQDLAQTRQELQSNLDNAQSQLGGQIAKTHGELVALEQKGERNYYEFGLGKEKHFSHEGPLSLKLRKANVKHQYCDLEIIVNDRELTQKHVNLYAPVVFYAEGGHRPVELVINGIRKDHMHGYVSEPKYPAARAVSASNAGPATPAPVAQRATPDLAHRPQPAPKQ